VSRHEQRLADGDLTPVRAFWLTLFAIAAAVVLAIGWSARQPWTAAAFVAFFSSRVARSEVKRRLARRHGDDAVRRAHQFILVTAAGWLAAGGLALVATVAGEGQEWTFVAPFFLAMGALNLYVAYK
jgi:hypothetical protein